MDALVTKCLKCGEPLPERRKLKDFCSYSYRGQHAVEALDGPKYQIAAKRHRRSTLEARSF
jgi:hypothetical protein